MVTLYSYRSERSGPDASGLLRIRLIWIKYVNEEKLQLRSQLVGINNRKRLLRRTDIVIPKGKYF